MKIKLLSDLHLSHHPDKGDKFISSLGGDADVLVIAGDLTGGHIGIKDYIERFCSLYPSVIYVLGNHEYYGSNRYETLDLINGINIANFHWLEDSKIDIDGQTFIGSTLWFARHHLSQYLSKSFSDFRHIDLLNTWVYDVHENTKKFLSKNVSEQDIVITHHAPTKKACDPVFDQDLYNIFFYADLEDIIAQNNPKLWLCGHSHYACDFYLKSTKIINNPYGYWGRELTGFNDGIIEV